MYARHWWQTPRGKAAAALGVVVLGLLAWWGRGGRGGGEPAADQAVPVTATAAYQGRFAAYLSEPGTVAPANSVVVRSRVDGELTRVAFSGGQMVGKGDLLAEIDPRPFQAQLQLATGDLARSQAQLANAQEILKRYQTLLAQNSMTRQRVDDQQSLVNQYAAEVKANQGRIDTAQLQLSYTRITAPIAGMVGLRRVDPGNLVGPSDPNGIAVITQSQPSRIVFAVPAGSVAYVLGQLHDGACIPVQAYADGAGEALATGRVQAVNNEVDPATGTVKVEARFANARGTLLPNQFVTVRLPVQVLPRATMVPAAAVQHGAAGPFVYVLKDDGTVAVAPVRLGPGDAGSAVVEEGVAPGTRVVVEGADRLRAGTRVKAAVAAPPPPAEPLPECHEDAGGPPPPVSSGGAAHAGAGRQHGPVARP